MDNFTGLVSLRELPVKQGARRRLAWPSGQGAGPVGLRSWVKSFSLPLAGFVFGSPEFNSSMLCK